MYRLHPHRLVTSTARSTTTRPTDQAPRRAQKRCHVQPAAPLGSVLHSSGLAAGIRIRTVLA